MGKKSFLALLLSALLMLSPAMQLFSVAAVSDETTMMNGNTDIATISGGDLVQGRQLESGTEEKQQLPTPTGLQWFDDESASWKLRWDGNDEGAEAWVFEIYKDGELFYSDANYGNPIFGHSDYYYLFIGDMIEDSGTYTVRVKWRAESPWTGSVSDLYTDGEWSEFSEPRVYTRPEKALGAVQVYWGEEQGKKFIYWDELDDSLVNIMYDINIYHIFPDSDKACDITDNDSWAAFRYYSDGRDPAYDTTLGIQSFVKDGKRYIRSDYVDESIQAFGAGRYRAQIQAYSMDIDKVANGPMGELSAFYDTTKTAGEVSTLISEALASSGGSYERALEIIEDSIDIYSLRTAMQTDSTVLDQIKELESGYIAERGITVEAPSVSVEAAAYVNATDISVVGAGLNAAAGNKVWLEVSVPEIKKNVSSFYYTDNSIQLDISLKRNGESVHELDVPITITMPVPEGIDVHRLVILHYHEDGSYEVVRPKENGDGTVTFTVTEFSTFVFAEAVTLVSDDGNKDDTNTGAGSADTNSGSTQQNNDDSLPMQSPKTGEDMGLVQILAYAIIVLAAGIGTFRVWKKKENEETAK